MSFGCPLPSPKLVDDCTHVAQGEEDIAVVAQHRGRIKFGGLNLMDTTDERWIDKRRAQR